MASTVKTAISMQEELFEQVNSLAGKLQISRSKLFAIAVQDFIKKNENHDFLSQINKAFDDYPDSNELQVRASMKKKQAKTIGSDVW
ncbi:Helix-turn-helix protein, CopG [Desulfamplus magnetovallimortis]|uniref:Helix-turn-helix protein, CopG n=1 Tax=Desulfamplus magnetovallimortis TaxID=1246637 RepID=A0A1W1H8E5_9BACT|nr:CopG family transcriptional regulator [Desulfamplus magnetovallimortis]SLM28732.1 Helix-turn-helix protein, CopG [Desulfamplus magnetovallimortis]